MNQKKYQFHVISNTHWDREWRYPFQRNRQQLVAMMDQLLKILAEEPEYSAFHLDSQAVVLHDYLEIRPQNRPLLEKYITEKRIFAGPWYILPEEFQVGGENLIRNLLLGHRTATEFGHVMKVGYSPFSWGQISQLPQIYREFGIEVVMFYRGINSLDSPKAEFIWEGADGTRVLASRFSTMPRYNFYFYIYRPVVHNAQVSDLAYKWERGGLPLHFCDADLLGEDYHIVEPQDTYYPENLQPAAEALIREQIDDFTTPHIFWAEGHDSSGPNRKTVRIIRDLNELLKQGRVLHSDLEQYAAGLLKDTDPSKLKVVTGERRSTQYDRRSGNLYGYTTSARMDIKISNFISEKWLQYYAEPWNVIAGLLGLDINDQYLEIAWQLLIQNSAHDSIGGCSIDAVHQDMFSRYQQVREIAQGLLCRAVAHLASLINLSQATPESLHCVILNPLPYKRDAICEAYLDVPEEMDQGGIALRDGNLDVPLQICDQQVVQPVVEQLIDRPLYIAMRRYHCFFDLREIPALGIKTLQLQPSPHIQQNPEPIGTIIENLPVLENTYLRVSIRKNGTLDILDKDSGQVFHNLAYFLSEGESGHAWIHTPVAPVLTTQSAEPRISLTIKGPLLAVVTIEHQFEVPVGLDAEKKTRIGKVSLPIRLEVILTRTARRVEFRITLNNCAESHRLRIMFPTGIRAAYSWAEGQFDVVRRSTARPVTDDWVEQPMYDFPLHHFVDLSNEKSGAAVIVAGLKEYEILPDCETIALTLLRGFEYRIQPSSLQDFSHEKGSQCLGQHTFRLAFYPHTGNWREGNVFREAQDFNYECRLFQMGRATGSLDSTTSFFSIEPTDLILSAIKKPEQFASGTLVLRLFNPTDQPCQGIIRTLFNLKSVTQLTLEELALTNLPLYDRHTLHLQVAPKKILTLRLECECPAFSTCR